MHLKAGEKLKAGKGKVYLERRVRDESSSSNHGRDNHDIRTVEHPHTTLPRTGPAAGIAPCQHSPILEDLGQLTHLPTPLFLPLLNFTDLPHATEKKNYEIRSILKVVENSIHSWLLMELWNCLQNNLQALGVPSICIKYLLNHPYLLTFYFFTT